MKRWSNVKYPPGDGTVVWARFFAEAHCVLMRRPATGAWQEWDGDEWVAGDSPEWWRPAVFPEGGTYA